MQCGIERNFGHSMTRGKTIIQYTTIFDFIFVSTATGVILNRHVAFTQLAETLCRCATKVGVAELGLGCGRSKPHTSRQLERRAWRWGQFWCYWICSLKDPVGLKIGYASQLEPLGGEPGYFIYSRLCIHEMQ
jgi:hypothetical protein